MSTPPVNEPTSGLVSRTATDDWEQALVTGNGRQGVLCYGGPAAVRLTFSHERLFLPLHRPLPAPDTAAILPELRRLLLTGGYAEAAQRVCDHAAEREPGYRELRWIDPLIGAATLTFTPDLPARAATGYRRGTDFRSGLVTQQWRVGTGAVSVRVFVSRPADVVVVRLRAEGTTLNGRLCLAPIDGVPPRPVDTIVHAEAGRAAGHVEEGHAEVGPAWLTLRARFPDTWPGAIAGHVVTGRVTATPGRAAAGTTTVEGDGLRVHGATDLVVLVRTTVAGPGEDVDRTAVRARATMAAAPADPDQLFADHRVAHGELFDRVRLRLSRRPAPARPTEDLLAAPVGPELIERLFDAGRYAVICACGELPPTLQGVWSGTYHPAWSSGYTLDGNLPAAVAALLPARTPELLVPLFDLLDSVADDLRENAHRLYGARGILTPAHLSTHGRQNHFGPVWCLTFWTAGAAWLSRLYVDYWRYTGDRAFLAERALPFLREAARFYLDFAHEPEPGAGVVFVPSLSPENHPGNSPSLACVNATMDVATVADLLRNLLAATAELGLDDPEEPRWRRLLAALPPLRVAATAELAEWAWPGLTENHAHRHASHLYPLWYEPDPAVTGDPRLRQAAIEAVRRRLAWWLGTEAQATGSRAGGVWTEERATKEPSDEGRRRPLGPGTRASEASANIADEMAYGLVQVGWAAAALGLADEAYQAVVALAGRYWRPSLVSTHNRGAIFNVDICGGLPALVLAMLMRGGPGRLDLLPALPVAWPRGRLTGAAARGQIVVRHLAWTRDRLDAVFVSGVDQQLCVGLPAGARVRAIAGTMARNRIDRNPISVTVGAGRPVRLRADLVRPTR